MRVDWGGKACVAVASHYGEGFTAETRRTQSSLQRHGDTEKTEGRARRNLWASRLPETEGAEDTELAACGRPCEGSEIAEGWLARRKAGGERGARVSRLKSAAG